MDLPIETYFEHALQFKEAERILLDDFAAWLPERVIDCHAHCNLREHVRFINDRSMQHMLSTFPYYSLEDSIRIKRLMYGGKDVRSLRFAKTFRGIDHRAANEYLLRQSPAQDRVAVYGLPEDVPYTIEAMHDPRCSAVKMYWSYIEPPAETIYQFFPTAVLEEAQAHGIPIILHLPKMIVRCIDDFQRLVADFPRLRIVLAHLGLSKLPVPGLEEAFAAAAKHPNVLMDTSLNPSPEVMLLALRAFGSDRIMFGSDEPLHLIRSVAFKHPIRGERIATEYPYHWIDPEEHAEYKHLAAGAIHAHWQSVGAIKSALARLPGTSAERMKQRIFYDNAREYFDF